MARAMRKIILTENDIWKMVRLCAERVLSEGYVDDVYESDNFKRWFSGSKIVDDEGRPLLLGHATRNFGFNRFNTEFIHLSTINDASFFSGGSRRMFKFKNTIDKLTDSEVVDLYNKYFTYNGDNGLVEITDAELGKIVNAYDQRMQELNTPEEIESMRKYRLDIENARKLCKIGKELFLKHYAKNAGKLCFVTWSKGLPRLFPGIDVKYTDKDRLNHWLKTTFPTMSQIRKWIIESMFEKDRYEGVGGTYPLCARVLNPLHIDCHWNTWDRIYIYKDCPEYDRIFDKYCKETGRNIERGSSFGLDNESIAYIAQQLGYDGVVFHNIREGAYGEARMKETYIVFSTKQLKTPFENSGEFGDIENMFK